MRRSHLAISALLIAAAFGLGAIASTGAAPSGVRLGAVPPADGSTIACDVTIGGVDNVCHAVAPATTTTTEAPTTTAEPTTTEATTSTSTPPSSTTTVPASTTPTTSTTAPTTSTTVPPTTTAPTTTAAPTTTTGAPPAGPACGLTSAAFCETFDAPHPVAGTRTGDLDPTLWGVSRTTSDVNLGQHRYNLWAATRLNGVANVRPPSDVRVINGQMIEAVTDVETQTVLATYPKQPFDVAGRTGTVMFDVSADALGPHAAWPEFFWTDQPIPAPVSGLPAQFSSPRNGIAVVLSAQCASGTTGVDHVSYFSNYGEHVIPVGGPCIQSGNSGSTGGAITLNHVRIKFTANATTTTRVTVEMTAPGSTTYRTMADVAVNVPATRGVVWLNDVHYNASKGCPGTSDAAAGCFNPPGQATHQFVWDNLGFDGPKPYRDMTFDVPDASVTTLGYFLQAGVNRTFVPTPVSWKQTPSSAFVNFNWFPISSQAAPSVSVNGGPVHSLTIPNGDTFGWRTIAIPITVSEVVAGTNKIVIKAGEDTVVANINLVLIAAAPVPA